MGVHKHGARSSSNGPSTALHKALVMMKLDVAFDVRVMYGKFVKDQTPVPVPVPGDYTQL